MSQKEKVLNKHEKKHTFITNAYQVLKIFNQIIVVQLVQTHVAEQSRKGKWKLVDNFVLYV